VRLDVVATEGERGVFENMMKKGFRADQMFQELVRHMNAAQKIERVNTETKEIQVPTWLK
jgi:hypothetical protein